MIKHQLLAGLLALVAPLACLGADESTTVTPGGKPNIILILADDLGYGALRCYGNKETHTPNIDQLAADGIRFTDFHSNGSLCSPTRAALLTGRYQQRCTHVPDEELSGIFREQRKANPDQRWAWGISAAEMTMPALLKQAGYRTALIGKWHLGYDSKFHPMNYGFEEFRGWIGGAVDNHTHVATHGTRELDWWRGRTIENDEGYSTDLLTRYATDFIGRQGAKPFFLYLAHGAVHTPLQGRDRSKRSPQLELYKEVLSALDDSVGAITKALREHHLEGRTLVVFCSDNGPAAPAGAAASGGLRGGKNTLFEGGHRVPFIAAWPGIIPAGTQSDATTMTMDLLPTLANLTGARIPPDVKLDGIDLMPILKGESINPVRELHWQSGVAWAVRRGSWKLMGQRDRPASLVNLMNDIGEAENVIRHEPERVSELMKAHARWLASLKDAGRQASKH